MVISSAVGKGVGDDKLVWRSRTGSGCCRGTPVKSFDLHAPHPELEVTSVSVVETPDSKRIQPVGKEIAKRTRRRTR